MLFGQISLLEGDADTKFNMKLKDELESYDGSGWPERQKVTVWQTR